MYHLLTATHHCDPAMSLSDSSAAYSRLYLKEHLYEDQCETTDQSNPTIFATPHHATDGFITLDMGCPHAYTQSIQIKNTNNAGANKYGRLNNFC